MVGLINGSLGDCQSQEESVATNSEHWLGHSTQVRMVIRLLNSLTSSSSQGTYDHAIREFIEWYCSNPRSAFNKTVVTRYRISF